MLRDNRQRQTEVERCQLTYLLRRLLSYSSEFRVWSLTGAAPAEPGRSGMGLPVMCSCVGENERRGKATKKCMQGIAALPVHRRPTCAPQPCASQPYLCITALPVHRSPVHRSPVYRSPVPRSPVPRSPVPRNPVVRGSLAALCIAAHLRQCTEPVGNVETFTQRGNL